MFTEVLHSGLLVTKASKAMIALHGRGGNARGMIALAHRLCDDHFYIAAPQAPNNSWYPHRFMEAEELNEPFLSDSIANIKNLIEEISQHIPLSQIYLMGFSQGACLTLEVATRFAAKYGGVIAFTGGLIGSEIRDEKYQGNFAGTKVFIGTSDQDPHIPLERSEQSKALMERLGADVTLNVYPAMAHTVCDEEISWVRKNMVPSKQTL